MVHILQHALKRFKVRLIRLLAVHLCPKTGFFFKKEFIETFFRDSQSVFSFHKIKVLIKGQKKNGFAFLAIGRPEAEGCYCRINAYLKDVITMLSREFDYVVIDGEAGIEQINRRVLEKVTHLLLVSDQSRKGIQVVGTIKQVADELVMYDRIGAVINRVTNPELNKFITIPGVEILSYIESDDYHAANDIQGKTVYDLPPESSVYRGTKEVLEKFGIL